MCSVLWRGSVTCTLRTHAGPGVTRKWPWEVESSVTASGTEVPSCACLSLRGHADVAGFVAAFTGSHRRVLDYLAEEVLERQCG